MRSKGAASALVTPRIASMSRGESPRFCGRAPMGAECYSFCGATERGIAAVLGELAERRGVPGRARALRDLDGGQPAADRCSLGYRPVKAFAAAQGRTPRI